MTPSLILASSSPFRRMLMENAGLHFLSVAAEIDERAIEAPLEKAGMPPEAVAQVLAREKALDVSRRYAGPLVIGSDQTMSLAQRVFHKPATMAQAREHLASLSGRTHRLNSAVCLVSNGIVLWEHVSHAQLSMRVLSDEFIDGYLSRVGDKAMTSVGGYQLEGEGIQLFAEIDGDYFTILGLPMLPLLKQLRELRMIDG